MTPNQKRFRELLDRQSRGRQRMAEIAAIEGDLSPEIRLELETLKNGTPGFERELRAARDADEQTDTHAEPDPYARNVAGIKCRYSFLSYLAVAAEHRGPAAEKAEMTLQGRVSVSFPIRFR